jgi:hypothetical protein
MEKDRTTRKIEREAARAQDKHRDARDGMKQAIRTAMEDGTTHKNIAQELLDARRGGNTVQNRERFGDDGEVITGYLDDSPWLRD